MQKPTCQDIANEEGFKCVDEKLDTWRHGTHRVEVHLRESDQTYWSVGYRVSSDGETNELRDGYATIFQVEPYDVTVKHYRAVATA